MNKLLQLSLILTLLTITPIYILIYSSPWPSIESIKSIKSWKKCDIFQGKWIWNPNNSYYTNATCREIFDHQNCIKFGRIDTDFLKWRWKPNGCELPLFDARQFLELVRGKSLAFVGDSLGRNQMQSLICLLASVVYPEDVSYTTDSRFKRWFYVNYNFTLASFWSPYLVKAIDTNPNGPRNLYLDEPNDAWSTKIDSFDYVIISAGRWLCGPQVFIQNGNVIKNLTLFYGYKRVLRTTFKTLIGLKNYNGVTFLRTFSPSHYENGEWNKGGNCNRTRPVLRGDMKLNGDDLKMYLTQVKEFKRAESEGKKRDLKFRLIDIYEAMVVRPDGHPNHYGHWPHENVSSGDCVHWCLPGPVDTWNEFLLQMLKMEIQKE